MKENSPSKAMKELGKEMASAFQEGLESATEISPEEVDRAIREAQRLLVERTEHKGDMKLWDYCDWSLEVDLQKKEIRAIEVQVLTGDEVVRVLYADGTEDNFDAGALLFNGRMMDDLDYAYVLTGDRIQKWLKFEPEEDVGLEASYQRARAFKAARGPAMFL